MFCCPPALVEESHIWASSFAGFSTVRQTLARAAPAAGRLWKQWRRGNPFHGGGHRGDGAVMDEPCNPKGRSLYFEDGTHRFNQIKQKLV